MKPPYFVIGGAVRDLLLSAESLRDGWKHERCNGHQHVIFNINARDPSFIVTLIPGTTGDQVAIEDGRTFKRKVIDVDGSETLAATLNRVFPELTA